MSYVISFIDKTVLTDRTDLGTNYSETNVRNAVLDAQRFDLYDVLGKNLYERFDTDIDNGDYAISGSYADDHPKYVELMEDYIVPYLTWASYVRLLDTIYLTPRNNGLEVRGESPVSTAQYSLKKDQGESKRDYFGKKLSEYLIDQQSEFDELTDYVEITSDLPQFRDTSSKLAFFGRGSKNKFNGYNL